MPTLIPPSVDYTDRDLAAWRLRLQRLANSVYPNWTAFGTADIGNLLLEAMGYTLDVLGYYAGRQARESYWPTLRQRRSAIRLGALIGFRLPGAAAATGSERFSLAAAATVAVTIPLGTALRTTHPTTSQRFRTTAAATIPVGSTFVDVAIEQAVAQSETFAATGRSNQEVILTQVPYLDDSAVVSAAEGAFTQVASFLGATSTSRVYVVVVDDQDRAHVRFGNGISGTNPTGTITIAYRTGGGPDGNVDAGTIRVLDGTIVDALGNPVTLTVTNPSPLSGGVPRMSVEAARLRGPASYHSPDGRTVGDVDYVNHALQVAGVARAMLITSNQDPAVGENTGRLQVVAVGTRLTTGRYAPAAPSAALVTAVRNHIVNNRPHPVTFTLTVEAVTFFDVTVGVRVYLAQGAVGATVGAAVRAALADFFAAWLADLTPNTDIDFGAGMRNAAGTVVAELPWSTVFNVVRDIAGIRRVDEGAVGFLLNGVRASLTVPLRQFPRLSTVTITDVDTGAAL